MKRKDLHKHVNELCPYREVLCLLNCGQRLPLNELDQHIVLTCPKTEVPCRNKCGVKVHRGLVEEHCHTTCKLEIIACTNKGESLFEDGCPLTMKRKDLDNHK